MSGGGMVLDKDGIEAFFVGLEKMFCVKEAGGVKSCLEECDYTFGQIEDKISGIRDYGLSYNDYNRDDYVSDKFVELIDKLEKNGQHEVIDRITDIASSVLYLSTKESVNWSHCMVIASIYDIIVGPLEAETNLSKRIEVLNNEKATLSNQIDKLAQENNKCQTATEKLNSDKIELTNKIDSLNQKNDLLTKSAEKLNEEKTDLSKQIDKLTQDNNWCHTSRQELIQSHMDLNEQKLELQRELGELDHLIKPLCHHMSNTSSLSTNELPSFDHGFMSLV